MMPIFGAGSSLLGAGAASDRRGSEDDRRDVNRVAGFMVGR